MDQFGNVLCETDDRDAGSRFQISISDDGKWALKNESRGYFLGGNPEKLTCTAKVPSSTEFWSVHLAARPQVSSGTYELMALLQFIFAKNLEYLHKIYSLTVPNTAFFFLKSTYSRLYSNFLLFFVYAR